MSGIPKTRDRRPSISPRPEISTRKRGPRPIKMSSFFSTTPTLQKIGVAINLLLWGVCGCGSSDSVHVKIILPTGYAGEFFVVEDSVHGKVVPYNNGQYVLHLPDEGILFVNDASFMSLWHKTAILYEDGTDVTLREKLSSGKTQSGTAVIKTKTRGEINVGSDINRVHVFELNPVPAPKSD